MRKKCTIFLLFMIFLSSSCEKKAVSPYYYLAELKTACKTGFSNGGWKYDRYKDLKSLDACTSMVVADLKGPGVITHIHTTRHQPEKLFSRGIVILIYFDGASEPAVCCPLSDFFGDGSNGNSHDFSSNLIECAPWSYNAYIPMPFKESAKVILRNDTDKNASNYSYVEWEKLPKWEDRYGYFHATYNRKLFRLDTLTEVTFFKIEGTGHFIGRQMSITTDDPMFRKGFEFVMEGNNEVNIDEEERLIDYLGTEDSYTFSWGFREEFIGLHAGMPLIELGDTSYLSIYRFHDHMPIRFNKRLEWKINWQHEYKIDIGKNDGCVDYASVFYWYQDVPAGFTHDLLPPVSERQLRMIK